MAIAIAIRHVEFNDAQNVYRRAYNYSNKTLDLFEKALSKTLPMIRTLCEANQRNILIFLFVKLLLSSRPLKTRIIQL